ANTADNADANTSDNSDSKSDDSKGTQKDDSKKDRLADTGSSGALWISAGALALVLLGAGVTVLARKRSA
ncbi:MAG TPA: hypothetical protein DEX36_13590, partial [Glutamicibacter sp.]